jgi:hypothetical protein
LTVRSAAAVAGKAVVTGLHPLEALFAVVPAHPECPTAFEDHDVFINRVGMGHDDEPRFSMDPNDKRFTRPRISSDPVSYPLDAPLACKFFHRGVNDTYLVSSPSGRFVFRVYRASWRQQEAVAARNGPQLRDRAVLRQTVDVLRRDRVSDVDVRRTCAETPQSRLRFHRSCWWTDGRT